MGIAILVAFLPRAAANRHPSAFWAFIAICGLGALSSFSALTIWYSVAGALDIGAGTLVFTMWRDPE